LEIVDIQNVNNLKMIALVEFRLYRKKEKRKISIESNIFDNFAANF